MTSNEYAIRDNLLFNLAEAKEAIEILIADIENDPEHGEPELKVSLQHIYWHINGAWNGRNNSEPAFEVLIQYPKDLPM